MNGRNLVEGMVAERKGIVNGEYLIVNCEVKVRRTCLGVGCGRRKCVAPGVRGDGNTAVTDS